MRAKSGKFVAYPRGVYIFAFEISKEKICLILDFPIQRPGYIAWKNLLLAKIVFKKIVRLTIENNAKRLDHFITNRLSLIIDHFAKILVTHA